MEKYLNCFGMDWAIAAVCVDEIVLVHRILDSGEIEWDEVEDTVVEKQIRPVLVWVLCPESRFSLVRLVFLRSLKHLEGKNQDVLHCYSGKFRRALLPTARSHASWRSLC